MMVQHLQDSFTALERARMPVLVAVQGGCIGGAVDMVCAADMRYAVPMRSSASRRSTSA